MALKYMERYKEELFINEASHSFWSPPGSMGPFSKWVASHELTQCSYYFKNGLRPPLI